MRRKGWELSVSPYNTTTLTNEPHLSDVHFGNIHHLEGHALPKGFRKHLHRFPWTLK